MAEFYAALLEDTMSRMESFVSKEFVAEVFASKEKRDPEPVVIGAKACAVYIARAVYSAPPFPGQADVIGDDDQQPHTVDRHQLVRNLLVQIQVFRGSFHGFNRTVKSRLTRFLAVLKLNWKCSQRTKI